MVGERGFEPPPPLVPNSVYEKRLSDTDEVRMIASANVHTGLVAIPHPSPVPERHNARAPDTGRDRRVTTQLTTQKRQGEYPPIVQGVPTPPSVAHVPGRVQKKLKKSRELA